MEAAPSCETLIHLTTAQCRNPEEGHHLIKNRREIPKTYKILQAGLLNYFTIELKKWACLLCTGDVAVFPVDCCCGSDCWTEASCKVTVWADNTIMFQYTEPFQRLNVCHLNLGLHKT